MSSVVHIIENPCQRLGFRIANVNVLLMLLGLILIIAAIDGSKLLIRIQGI